MSEEYVVISDTHNHNFSAFSRVVEWRGHNINSRHADILNAMLEVFDFCRKNGVKRLYHAGDMFHVRGQVAPSVMNPVLEVYRLLVKAGIKVAVIAGNHDLESRESVPTMNASGLLRDLGVHVVDSFSYSDDMVCMVPWRSKVDDLKAELAALAATQSGKDLVIHAPLNGVIKGIPDLGLEPEFLEALGFRNVFVGHFHDHKQAAKGVYSVGALTHQTWNDVGTAAGFVHVNATGSVTHHRTSAPSFVDAEPGKTSNSKGNYVRIRVEVDPSTDVEAIRQEQLDAGALGVVVHPIRKQQQVQRSTQVKTLGTLGEAVNGYIDANLSGDAAVAKLCSDILSETESV